MVSDLIKIFKNAENMEKTILDNYIPKDGTYFRINKDDTIERLTIKRNQTEQSELYKWFKEAEYNSNLIDMNKPIDTTKKILTKIVTNKEKMLTQEQLEEAIDKYFNTFLEETKDKKAKRILETINLENIDEEELQTCKIKIKNAIPKIIEEIEANNLSDKKYVKIFIEKDIEKYRKEGNRYLYPRIFNKNDYNIELNGEIWGLSNDNMRTKQQKAIFRA